MRLEKRNGGAQRYRKTSQPAAREQIG